MGSQKLKLENKGVQNLFCLIAGQLDNMSINIKLLYLTLMSKYLNESR